MSEVPLYTNLPPPIQVLPTTGPPQAHRYGPTLRGAFAVGRYGGDGLPTENLGYQKPRIGLL